MTALGTSVGNQGGSYITADIATPYGSGGIGNQGGSYRVADTAISAVSAISNTGGTYVTADIAIPSGSYGISNTGGAYVNPTARPAAQLTSTHPGTRPPGQGGLIVERTTGGARG